MKVQIASPCTLFARFCPLRLFSSQFEKKWYDGKRFANNEEVKCYFEELNGSQYKPCIEVIEHRCEKCIELNGGYVEK